MTAYDDDRVSHERAPTEKWRALPDRVHPSQLVETIDPDPRVAEIRSVNYGAEFIRIDHG
ncbi:hypothetical protein QEZ54_04475 [Catellatospora sp. KI3]|uniref:hypothetical protein n=1 Tax=Catellatospora sp. KI3 TaxID=3041620 RepID=UPI002482E0EE|nr:hypothetical protein [Catellatospora sp. KI3]MDI1460215.1 hypothetical protein [Catellatospora sp. KI3]